MACKLLALRQHFHLVQKLPDPHPRGVRASFGIASQVVVRIGVSRIYKR